MTTEPTKSKCVHCGGDLILLTMISGKSNPCNAQRIDIPADLPPKQLVEIQEDGLGKQRLCHSGFVSHYAVCKPAREAREAEKKKQAEDAEKEGQSS